jgi:hypothetical protein
MFADLKRPSPLRYGNTSVRPDSCGAKHSVSIGPLESPLFSVCGVPLGCSCLFVVSHSPRLNRHKKGKAKIDAYADAALEYKANSFGSAASRALHPALWQLAKNAGADSKPAGASSGSTASASGTAAASSASGSKVKTGVVTS